MLATDQVAGRFQMSLISATDNKLWYGNTNFAVIVFSTDNFQSDLHSSLRPLFDSKQTRFSLNTVGKSLRERIAKDEVG
jgi:hypothetical protein